MRFLASGFEKLLRSAITKEFEIAVPSVVLPSSHAVNVDASFRSPSLVQLGAIGRTLDGIPLFARYCLLDLDKLFPVEKVGPGFMKNRTEKKDSTIGELSASAYGELISREVVGLKDFVMLTDSILTQRMLCSNYRNRYSQEAHKVVAISSKCLLMPNAKLVIHVPGKDNVADLISKLHQETELKKDITVETINEQLEYERPYFRRRIVADMWRATNLCPSFTVTKGRNFENLKTQSFEIIQKLLK